MGHVTSPIINTEKCNIKCHPFVISYKFKRKSFKLITYKLEGCHNKIYMHEGNGRDESSSMESMGISLI